MLTPTQTPFKNIGLAFSGGGYRAASFSLGTLSYLSELKQVDGTPLLQNVTYISSASGGTIANAIYALYNAKGRSFGEFYKHLFENLEGVILLDRVFENLNSDKVWKDRPDKRRNFINAFALAYDKLLFDGACAGDLVQSPPTTHLDEVCFNTTDFFRGLSFRQAIKLRKDSKADEGFLYGNFMLHFKDDPKKEDKPQYKIKLGDMLAASSCFPGGFEPIVFPGDFANADLSVKTLIDNLHIGLQEMDWSEFNLMYPNPPDWQSDNNSPVKNAADNLPKPIDVNVFAKDVYKIPVIEDFTAGFMDGGIADNQGIESLMRANERRVKKESGFEQFDFMMINDVGSHYMTPYEPSEKKNKFSGPMALTINNLIVIGLITLIVGGIALFMNFNCDYSSGWSKFFAVLWSFVFVLSAGLLGGIFWLRSFIKGKINGNGLDLDQNFSPAIVQHMFQHFGKTPLGVIIKMLSDRVSSLALLVSDVFMKRIRQILYAQFMDEGRRTFRMKTNHAYDLSYSNDLFRTGGNPVMYLEPTPVIQMVAQYAFEQGTTLWYDTTAQQDNSMAAIIACGQFNTCYNLLAYIARLKADPHFQTLTQDYKDRVDKLNTQLTADYEVFKKDPFWLYNKLGKAYGIADFKEGKMSDIPNPTLKPTKKTKSEFYGVR